MHDERRLANDQHMIRSRCGACNSNATFTAANRTTTSPSGVPLNTPAARRDCTSPWTALTPWPTRCTASRIAIEAVQASAAAGALPCPIDPAERDRRVLSHQLSAETTPDKGLQPILLRNRYQAKIPDSPDAVVLVAQSCCYLSGNRAATNSTIARAASASTPA